MYLNKQFGFMLLLGIITSFLLYNIIDKKSNTNIEGLTNPLKALTKPINSIISKVKDVIEFLCFMKKWFRWLASTFICLIKFLNPLCWIPYLIDAILSFLYAISLYILKPFQAEWIIKSVRNGKNVLAGLTGAGYPKVIINMCYSCKIKPMPTLKKPKIPLGLRKKK